MPNPATPPNRSLPKLIHDLMGDDGFGIFSAKLSKEEREHFLSTYRKAEVIPQLAYMQAPQNPDLFLGELQKSLENYGMPSVQAIIQKLKGKEDTFRKSVNAILPVGINQVLALTQILDVLGPLSASLRDLFTYLDE
jgi:hypothetical protein